MLLFLTKILASEFDYVDNSYCIKELLQWSNNLIPGNETNKEKLFLMKFRDSFSKEYTKGHNKLVDENHLYTSCPQDCKYNCDKYFLRYRKFFNSTSDFINSRVHALYEIFEILYLRRFVYLADERCTKEEFETELKEILTINRNNKNYEVEREFLLVLDRIMEEVCHEEETEEIK